MSITINSNLAASKSSINLKRASDRLSKSLQRLSSGNRIVNSSDDAGGLAVAMKLQSSLRRATASMMNTQNGTSFLQMQDSVLKITGEIIDRMSELKSFWNDVSKNDKDRETYNHEFHELQKELSALKGQKFNGVSLFASTRPDMNNLKIITSDDGLGNPIELARVGLFENMKSRFGADGVLNSGSHGQYRQLVGNYIRDAGVLDANPGYATRDYTKGEVVFRSDEGYFMALNDVVAGAKVSVSNPPDVNSNWIRIADKSGNGFAEAYPDAPLYDHNNLKFNSSGDAVAYLEGDILKVQAHWNDPNSFIYIKAETDVPRNITLDKIISNYVGEGKYFDYVGVDSANGRPTSSYIMPNKEHLTPDEFDPTDKDVFAKIMNQNLGNNFTPTYVQNKGTNDIYQPTQNWELKEWSPSGIFKYGDTVVSIGNSGNSKVVFDLTENVKGSYLGGNYDKGSIVLYQGQWFKAGDDIVGDTPAGHLTNKWALIDNPLGDADFADDKTAEYMNLSNESYWTKTHFGDLIGKTIDVDYTLGDNIYHEGKYYIYSSHLPSSDKTFTAGSGQSGITAFEQLLMQGAVTELNLHVNTVGGGGASNLAHGVYYKPNQELEFIDRIPDSGLVRTNSIERRTDPNLAADEVFNSADDVFYTGLNPGGDGIYGTMDDYYTTTAFSGVAMQGGHVDSDADNNKDLLDTANGLEDFSVADFVDYIQTVANFRAMTGGTLSRLDYAGRMLEENQINLEAAHGRIMDADVAKEAAKMAQQNVLMQAGAAMVSQANQMNQIVLQLLQ